ncbi:MAG: peptidoglycan DD-metalloendopeptidase family protein [Patescibacteria group bacterium]
MPIVFRIFLILILSCWLSAGFTAAQTDDERIASLREDIERLERQADEYRKNIAGEHGKADSLNKEISIIQNHINNLKTQINITLKKIDSASLEIDNVTGEIYSTQDRIEYQKSAMGELLLELYRQDRESFLIAIMKNTNISDFLNIMQQTANVGESLLALVNDLRETKNAYEDHKDTLESKKKELENLNYRQITQKLSLNGTQKEKDNLLKITKGQEAEYQRLLKEVEIKQSLFFTELKEIETKVIQGGLYILRVVAKNLPPKGTDLFRWPEDNYRITQEYGCTSYSRCGSRRGPYGGAIHSGIDMTSGFGSPIKAIGDGEVIANGTNKGWGNWVAVKHPPYDLVSIYGHMSAFEFVRVGSQIKAGNIIGYEGSTGFSTGSHVHLSVYKEFFTYINEKNGQLYFNYENTINPNDYLAN